MTRDRGCCWPAILLALAVAVLPTVSSDRNRPVCGPRDWQRKASGSGGSQHPCLCLRGGAAGAAGGEAAAEGMPAGAQGEEDESAAPEDRGELRAPYYDGVRVRCLFVHGDTKEEQWCCGKIEYTKLSTRELRIAFDEVPSWESVRRIYWPIDDEDIKVEPGQEGGPSLSAEERQKLSREMLAMCEVFDWHRVRRALWFGADPAYSEEDLGGQTVLHLAAAADDTDTVKAAVRRSENKIALLNLETLEGNTPLHYAAASSEALVLRMLLRAGANMAAKNKFGDLPLHLAEAAGNAPGYKMLHDAMAKRLAELRQRGAPAGGGAARAK